MFEIVLEKIKSHKWETTGIIVGLLLFGILGLNHFGTHHKEDDLNINLEKKVSTITEKKVPMISHVKDKVSNQVTVDVKGAVNHLGVYSLPSQSRVTDAIKRAGGLSNLADSKSVNLAQKLQDETVIYVAQKGEKITVVEEEKANNIATQGNSKGKINLNKADLSSLQTISGVGAKRAQDILDYRDSQGGFKTIDDLKNVSGIGEKTLEKLRQDVTLD
ncbi:helix-hairpin-helix domain-containing protein [Streptococcus agalactiae]|uniref:helix-hairpin-helix domain-containing protein n=2 Tax=Streptococcus TaxID=1301 RepID=UPI001E494DBC|nr:helix-hairpin-helix domain-containing protein [Streptococcus agalactiae]MCC4749029.1 helix-hairpin-helix domain-containing protein [Streptococcus agalactiae]MCC8210179.1 helix-hairpin-helix domain-containing protein [Streptococcus agalactiae]